MAVAAQKVELQKEFKKEFGIHLWKPRPGGGTMMDGRCSRLAFSRPEKFSQLSGMPIDLIKDYNRLVVALASGADLSPKEYGILANSWLDRFHANEDICWNVMSPTVHLVLHHGQLVFCHLKA